MRNLAWWSSRWTVFLRTALVVALGACVWTAAEAKAASVEYLQVPSPSMGRNIPVAFQGGGPHAVFLLDAFNANPDVSNWVTAGDAMNALGGRGISVVAPAGGAYSMYTNWEQDRSKQWETFLTSELPDWLAVNKGLAPGGHAIVGASQGGTAALTLAEYFPNRFRYAGSMSGFINPSNTAVNGALHDGMMRYGGVDTNLMWGPSQLGRWKWHDPYVRSQLLTANGTRIWVYSPQTLTASDPAAMVGYPDQAQASNRAFYAQYRSKGGMNGHFDFPASGDHGWGSWAPQLRAMSDDLVSSIT
ncbi:alpha/beta hydrolase-fold protein [Mycolicibacterium sp. jd]|uniref:alpha/beta hydrolase-fold protein n=1 Tax=unclassified Mycolicibacterium TaxID=2636767 RepID=UPI00351AB483